MKEKQVGLFMFLKNGHLCMSSAEGHSEASPFIPLNRKSIESSGQCNKPCNKNKEESNYIKELILGFRNMHRKFV